DNGRPFSAANLKVSFVLNGRRVTWTPGMKDKRNLGATIRTLDGVRGGTYDERKEVEPGKWEPTGRKLPLDLGHGFLSRSGWALVDDSAKILFDEKGWVTRRPEGKRLDWYLFLHGHDYKGALADAAQVFGRQPLPPRFAFGYWWSRYWAYSDKEIEAMVEQFDTQGIPLDVMVIDMDWHKEGWTGYSWDRRYFPDPDEFLAWLKKRNLKISLNLHPADGVAKFEDAFPAMVKTLGLDPRKTDRVPMNVIDPKFMDAYFRCLHHPMEKQGVDFWWMDWQQGESSAMPGLDPLPWINHLHWRDMQTNPARRGKRPLIFSRFGGVGAGRYCIGFSGDTWSVWDSLAYQPYFTATAANVLYGYWSHDIGGHINGEIEPELYARWIQFGIHSPVVRTHTTKNAKAERRVWAYPEPYGPIMADALRQRYEMIPYIYTEARVAFDTGLSLCRPMYYEWPEREEAYKAKDQYLFGSQMLVAPVLKPVDPKTEFAHVDVWLPPGQWFDTARGCFEKGGRTIRRGYLIAETPVFVRAGTILPGQGRTTRVTPGSYRNLVVTAYPGGDGEYRLYEDDGVSLDYQAGAGAWILLTQRVEKGARRITVGPAQGTHTRPDMEIRPTSSVACVTESRPELRFRPEGCYAGFESIRSLELRLPAAVPPTEVTVGGKRLAWAYRLGREGWTYDGQTATVIVRLQRMDVGRQTTITLRQDPALPASLALGLKGLMARIARVSYYARQATSALIFDREERLGADLEQVGNRVSRNPASLAQERRRLNRLLPALAAMLPRLGSGVSNWEPGINPQRVAVCEKALDVLKAALPELAGRGRRG
ncbi:MAG: TIM-barrel domain-containing protein, partial [Kiritimatiellia bacterium]